MRMIKTILIFALISISFNFYSQETSPVYFEKNILRTTSLAKEALRVGDYYLAIAYFEEVYVRDTNEHKIIQDLAELYRITNNYKKAEIFYTKLDQHHKITRKAEIKFYLATLKKSNGKYEEALVIFQALKKQLSLISNEKIKKLYKSEMAGCEFAIASKDSLSKVLVNTMGKNVNDSHVEANPIPLTDNEIIYNAYKENKEVVYTINEHDSLVYPKRTFYSAEKEGEQWKAKGTFFDELNDEDYDLANGTFSNDGQRFYFTKCSENWQFKSVCQIYVISKKGHEWSEPEKLNELINIPEYTSSHPTIGRNFKTNSDVLFFVSDREGGRGGLDIWSADYDPRKKEFKKPRNCGSAINSIGDDVTPFFDVKTKTLYFASNGRPNFGGLDVFKVVSDPKGWSAATNMGKDINSPADDLDFILKPSGKGGFFVSNRIGGNSLYHATCCDDLYEFNYLEYIKASVNLSVVDEEMKNCLKENEKINVYIIENESKFLVTSLKSTDCMNSIELRPDFEYVIEVNKPGYFNNEINISTKSITETTILNKTIELKKRKEEPLILSNIQFEFNSANLTHDSKNIIDTTIVKICQKNPHLIIAISAHTDDKGSDEYNQKLSQKRAESILNYLHSQGLSKQQFKAIGSGETRPIALNQNPDGSDNPEGRAKNRRVEFRFIGELNPEEINNSNNSEEEIKEFKF